MFYIYTKKDSTKAIQFQSPDFKAWFLWPDTHIGFWATWLKIYIFETRRVCDCIVVFTFYTQTFALKSNYLHHHQLYIQRVNVRIYYLYTWNFPTKIFHQMETINIYWPLYSTHRLLKRQKPSYKFNAKCWYDFIKYNEKKKILHALSFVSRNQPKIWCSSVCVLIINVCASSL